MPSRSLLMVAFISFVLAGCATRGLRYAWLPVDPSWELLYVGNGSDLCVDPRDAVEARTVFQSTKRVLLPRCSPHRTRLAFYEFSDREGKLKIVEIDSLSLEGKKNIDTLAELDGPMGQRIALFPPIWTADGKSLLVVDQGGIHRIAMDRANDFLVAKEDILAVSISPDGTQIAYADGEEISIADMNGKHVASFRTTSPSHPERQDVQPIAFSPDGARIAYAAGRDLRVLDLRSMKASGIDEMDDPIYWIQWLPGGERLVFVTGTSVRNIRSSPTAAAYAVTQAYYELYAINADGHGLEFLFKDKEMDAHLSQPSLSPDGRHVALVSGTTGNTCVMIVSTDRARATRLAASGTSNHASWLPACQTVVVYPMD